MRENSRKTFWGLVTTEEHQQNSNVKSFFHFLFTGLQHENDLNDAILKYHMAVKLPFAGFTGVDLTLKWNFASSSEENTHILKPMIAPDRAKII